MRYVLLGAAMIAFATFPASAQTRLPLVGIVFNGDPQSSSYVENSKSFLRGMADLGYVEGHSIAYDLRFWGSDASRIPAIIADFVSNRVDLIVTQATVGALSVRSHAPSIATVFVSVADPVGAGLIDSFGRPGGRMTGLAMLSPELAVKRLELLKELLPGVRQVAVLRRRGSEQHARIYGALETAAPRLQTELIPFDAVGPGDAEEVARAIIALRPKALLVLEDPNIYGNFFPATGDQRSAVRELHRMVVTMCAFRTNVRNGCFASYGPLQADQFYRAASYADKILKGADPADLPVHQPSKFDLAVNGTLARLMSITIPPAVMVRVDEVIE